MKLEKAQKDVEKHRLESIWANVAPYIGERMRAVGVYLCACKWALLNGSMHIER